MRGMFDWPLGELMFDELELAGAEGAARGVGIGTVRYVGIGEVERFKPELGIDRLGEFELFARRQIADRGVWIADVAGLERPGRQFACRGVDLLPSRIGAALGYTSERGVRPPRSAVGKQRAGIEVSESAPGYANARVAQQPIAGIQAVGVPD